MEKIEGVDLGSLVIEASRISIAKRKELALTLVSRLLHRIEGLAQEEKKFTSQLKQTQEKIKKSQDQINRLKEGDWAALANLEKEFSGGTQPEKEDVKG